MSLPRYTWDFAVLVHVKEENRWVVKTTAVTLEDAVNLGNEYAMLNPGHQAVVVKTAHISLAEIRLT